LTGYAKHDIKDFSTLRVWLSTGARRLLDSLPDGIDKAQIRGALRLLEDDYDSVRSWPSEDSPGGHFTFAGSEDKWKLTYHIVEMEEPVLSVVTIANRRTRRWAWEFYPKKD
jgi:hypothetical protein